MSRIRGASNMEYGLIAALLTLLVSAAAAKMADKLKIPFNRSVWGMGTHKPYDYRMSQFSTYAGADNALDGDEFEDLWRDEYCSTACPSSSVLAWRFYWFDDSGDGYLTVGGNPNGEFEDVADMISNPARGPWSLPPKPGWFNP